QTKKPYLQGWAVVENTTDEDWNGVRMALISGRPISFQMNLYDSLFIKRPVVEPELFASLRPVTYSGGLGALGGAGGLPDANAMDDMRRDPAKMPPGGFGGRSGAAREKGASKESLYGLQQQAGQDKRYYADGVRKSLEEDMKLGETVQSAATASKLGDYFQYA